MTCRPVSTDQRKGSLAASRTPSSRSSPWGLRSSLSSLTRLQLCRRRRDHHQHHHHHFRRRGSPWSEAGSIGASAGNLVPRSARVRFAEIMPIRKVCKYLGIFRFCPRVICSLVSRLFEQMTRRKSTPSSPSRHYTRYAPQWFKKGLNSFL